MERHIGTRLPVGSRSSARRHKKVSRRKEAPSSRILCLKIGQLRVETWAYRNSKKEPFARLVFEGETPASHVAVIGGAPKEPTFDSRLDPMHASAIAVALDRWYQSVIAEDGNGCEGYFSAEARNLSVRLTGSGAIGKAPAAELTVTQYDGLIEKTLMLTPLEAIVLSGALYSIVAGEEE